MDILEAGSFGEADALGELLSSRNRPLRLYLDIVFARLDGRAALDCGAFLLSRAVEKDQGQACYTLRF